MVAAPPTGTGGELERLATRRRVVALTFDAGGNADGARRLFATLERTGIPVTFFLTGRWVRLYPALARTIGRQSQWAVGDHTVRHLDMTRLTSARARWEVTEARAEIERATGVDPRPLFRFPYGSEDERVRAIVAALGFVDVRWTVDTWGWMGSCCQTAAGVVRRVLDHLEPGEIVLMHLGSANGGATLDTDALPAVIAALRARGYGFVTLRATGSAGRP